MSMAHAVEVRPPFLDHRIVEFAATLPGVPEDPRLAPESHSEGTDDAINCRQRSSTRRKVGFDIPAHEWLRGPLRPLAARTPLNAGRRRARRPVSDTEIVHCSCRLTWTGAPISVITYGA